MNANNEEVYVSDKTLRFRLPMPQVGNEAINLEEKRLGLINLYEKFAESDETDFEDFFIYFEENFNDKGWNVICNEAIEIYDMSLTHDVKNSFDIAAGLLSAAACQSAESALRIVAKKTGQDPDYLIGILNENI